jgi:hypothetical protein
VFTGAKLDSELLKRWMEFACRGNQFPGGVGGGGVVAAIGASVHLNAATQAVTGSLAAITWDTLDFDTSSFWNAGTPTILTAPFTGLYLCTANALFANLASSIFTMTFRKNASALDLGFSAIPSAAVGQNAVHCSVLLSLNATDTIGCFLDVSPGVSATINGSAQFSTPGALYTCFSMFGFH